MRESAIQSNVVNLARGLGIKARKLGFGEGWPDYMFLWNGQILFIEFKKPGEKPTALQVHVQNELRDLGFQVEVVDDLGRGYQLMRNWYDRNSDYLAKVRRDNHQDK